MSAEVTDVINTLGPEMFPDFDAARIVADPFSGSPTSSKHRRSDSNISGISDTGSPPPFPRTNTDASIAAGSGYLPRNESFKNLGNIGLFATRPPSRSRSRSSSSGGAVGSGSFPLKSFSTLDSKSGFEEVSMKIRGAMKERGQIRRRQSDFAREEEEANDSENERKDE